MQNARFLLTNLYLQIRTLLPLLPGNIQVIKNWQSYRYTEHETIRMRKILQNHLFEQKLCKLRLHGPVT